MFRVSHKGEGIDDADTIDGARDIVRSQPPGRCDTDGIRAEPLGVCLAGVGQTIGFVSGQGLSHILIRHLVRAR